MERITTPDIQPFETEHYNTVRKLAAECTVLLKKDGLLPLAAPCPVALYGSGARHTVKGGTGSGDVNVRAYTTIEAGLMNAGFTVTSGSWLNGYDRVLQEAEKAFILRIQAEAAEKQINPVAYAMGKAMPEPEYDLPLDAEGDLAVYVLARDSGEGADRNNAPGDIALSATEQRDILYLEAHYKQFLLVLNVGGMVDLTPLKDVKNILLLSQLGSATGDTFADLLLGRSVPSGKLAMTWAPIDAYPSTEGFGDINDTPYREGIYVGYRYFDAAGVKPVFPFGYGLGYTEFDCSGAEVSLAGAQVAVTADVKNTGACPGRETLQVYVSQPDSLLDVPAKVLAGYHKTAELAPGESERAAVTFDLDDLAVYDEKRSAWVLPEGDWIVLAGTSSENAQPAAILRLAEETLIEQDKPCCGKPGFEDLRLLSCRPALTDGLPVLTVAPDAFKTKTVSYSERPAPQPQGERCPWQAVLEGAKTVREYVSGLTDEELARIAVGQFDESGKKGSMIGNSAFSVAGAAGETTMALKVTAGLPSLVMADGPAGLRLCTRYKLVGGKVVGQDNTFMAMMKYMTEEQRKQLAASVPVPSQEEQEAVTHYVYCTAIPIGTAIAQSFNPALAEEMGSLVGEEMDLFGVHLWLAPAMNIQRSPLCGRNFEYYSEDPLLTADMAAGITRGVQKHPGRAVTIKHFACNNQETNRTRSNSLLSERALREIYLKAFERCVKRSGPETIMSSYNLINGEHTCNSHDLLTAILRDEWGFEGFVMTDWYAADGFMPVLGGTRNAPGTAWGCIAAGNDLTMPGLKMNVDELLSSLADGKISRGEVALAAERVVKAVLKLTQA